MARSFLSSLTTDASSELDVLGHDGDTLGVDGAKVGVFEEGNEVSFRGFLKGSDRRGLEAEIALVVLSNFSDQTLEGELSDEKLGRLLVSTDFSESDSSGSETMGLLHTSGGDWSGLSSGLGGDLLAWSLATSGLASGLLGTSHLN